MDHGKLLLNYLGAIKSPKLFSHLRDTLYSIDRLDFSKRFHWKSKSLEVQPIGSLSFKEEAAGKLRVFAMVDSITQMALQPLHDFLFTILKSIPNDGTFNQTSCIARAIKFDQGF